MQRKHLLMRDVAEQPPAWGTHGLSFTRSDTTAVERAVQHLFDRVLAGRSARPWPVDPFHALDHLRPSVLVERVRARLAGLEALSPPGHDMAAVRQRLQSLEGLHAGAAHGVAREVAALTEAVVEEAGQLVGGVHQQAFATRPADWLSQVPKLSTALAKLVPPTPDGEPLKTLQRLDRALHELHTRRGEVMPAALALVQTRLLTRCREVFDAALAAQATASTGPVLRWCTAALQEGLDQSSRKCGAVLECLDQVRAELQKRAKTTAELQAVSASSVILALPGCDEHQVIAGMVEQAQVSDERQLAPLLDERWTERLRAVAKERCPRLDAERAAAVELLLAVGPADAATAFADSVRASLGRGHSTYERVAQLGIERCARTLYSRAEPTVFVGARNDERHNVHATGFAIVELPAPTGPRDPEIRAGLHAAFQRLNPEGTELMCVESDDDSVRVARYTVGFPVGITETIGALLAHYLQCAQDGHPTNLIGILAESPLGYASPRYVPLLPRS